MVHAIIHTLLKEALNSLHLSGDIALEYPADTAHGDLSCNIAMQLAKSVGEQPRELAERIIVALPEHEAVAKVEVAGPGFINFFLSSTFFESATNDVLTASAMWGRGTDLAGRTYIVEYTDPNPFKEFHIGHLMSNAIGESIARLVESQGADVVRANYQGDVGVHVACAIWGMQQLGVDAENAERHGEAYAYGASAYKEDEKAKTEIDLINKQIYATYEGSPTEGVSTLYGIGRQASLERFEEIYKLLGTKFDEGAYFFESATGPVGKDLVLAHPNVFVESEGARVFKGEEYGLHTRVFLNKEGLPTYEAKELGLEKMKMERYPQTDRMLIVTANEITEYFKVVKKAMGMVYPDIAQKLTHIPHGMMKLTSGKMSSRTGNVITGASMLEDVQEAVHTKLQEGRVAPELLVSLTQQVAVSAIKYQILRQTRSKDIVFDEERSIATDGDSGPYLQYTYARARSIMRKADTQGVSVEAVARRPDVAVLEVEQLLYRFPSVVTRSVAEYEPHYVAHYLNELASAYNRWYAQEQVLDGSDAQRYKLALTGAVAITLKNGLWMLGIEAPEEM